MKLTSKASIAAFVLLNFFAAAAQSQDCVVASALVCDAGQCKTVTNSILIRVDADGKTVSRCDTKGCDEIPVELAQSGIMTNMSNGNRGYLLRVSTVDQSFVEVATMLTAVYLKYGTCKA
jgi:hypothetical protein